METDIQLNRSREITVETAQLDSRSKLATALRWSGALLLGASSLTFLVQGAYALEPVWRLGAFMLFLLALSIGGFVTGVRFQDRKGARTFLGLAAALSVVPFAQLGGMWFATFVEEVPWMSELIRFTSVPTTVLMALTLSGSLIALTNSFSGFSVLAKPARVPLTILFGFGALLLLLPTRDPGFVALLTVGLSTFSLWVLARLYSRNALMSSFEHQTAGAIAMLPIALLVARQSMYGVTKPLVLTGSLLMSLLLLGLAHKSQEIPERQSDKRAAGLLFLSLSWTLLVDMLLFSQPVGWYQGVLGKLAGQWWPLLGVTPACAILFIGSDKLLEGPRRTVQHLAVAGVMVVASFYQFLHSGMVISVTCLGIGILAVGFGHAHKRRDLLVSGAVVATFGLAEHLQLGLDLITMSPWISLAVFGTTTLLAATVVERERG